MMKWIAGATLFACSVFGAPGTDMVARKLELASAGPLAFGPPGILFVGDSAGASLVAIDTGDRAVNKGAGAIELKGINQKMAAALGTAPEQITIHDLAVNPVSHNVYFSVARGTTPVLLKLDAGGRITELALENIVHSRVSIPDAPADAKDARGNNKRMETITDLGYADGRVFIAGLSNEEFSSSLRSIPYPFQAANKGSSIEIFHGAHGRFETNAPVRTFTTYTVANKPHLLAAYTCTPLVTIPLSELTPGNKVKGKTIAELGNRNRPLDMIVYQKGGKDYILMANSSRGVMKLPAANLETYDAITAQTEKKGVPYETLSDMKGVQQLDRYDGKNALMLMVDGGSMDLRTVALP
ncbi:MAG TPA: hypothetical protein VFQ91_06015 [Bryobacteraceae bacterium]|nr:hypothetical protein [Bryobacteraceae bacterium]